MFSQTDTTHMTGGGRSLQNSITRRQEDSHRRISTRVKFTAVHVGQGSASSLPLSFVRSGGAGIYFSTGFRQLMAPEASSASVRLLALSAPIRIQPSIIPITGSTSATYMICGGSGYNLQPIGCTPQVNITTGPTTLSTTNYVQVCLNCPILGAIRYALIRTAGYSIMSLTFQFP